MHYVDARYTGTHAHGFATMGMPPGHQVPHHARLPGFCHSCGHPKAKCCCGCRECRKEAKELLVKAVDKIGDLSKDARFRDAAARAAVMRPLATIAADTGEGNLNVPHEIGAGGFAALATAQLTAGMGTAFIGGGCCVHLSIEYAPSAPTAVSAVLILVDDSEGTVMAWGKQEKAGRGYQVKEAVIATRPGADVTVLVINMTARVRWCEVFSC